MKTTLHILMVCLGNICRSPVAEGIMQWKAKEKKLDIIVDSAGTSSWHEGEKPDRRSIEVANKNGIDISKQRSRPFTKDDFEKFDLIFVMDKSNLSDIHSWIRNEPDKEKIHLLLEYAGMQLHEVPDPYYGGANGFDYVFKLLDDACEKALEKIQKSYE